MGKSVAVYGFSDSGRCSTIRTRCYRVRMSFGFPDVAEAAVDLPPISQTPV